MLQFSSLGSIIRRPNQAPRKEFNDEQPSTSSYRSARLLRHQPQLETRSVKPAAHESNLTAINPPREAVSSASCSRVRQALDFIALCYWHEFLDLVFFFKYTHAWNDNHEQPFATTVSDAGENNKIG